MIKEVLKYVKENEKIKDIEPNVSIGRNLLKAEDGDEIIDLMIEKPLRKACKIFRAKGIETVMSSANRKNVLPQGVKPTEKEDVRGKEYFLDSPTFEDAGKGYAWIMLNWDSLSKTNRDILFLLEERKGNNGDNVGEKRVWFIDGGTLLLSFREEREDNESNKRFEEKSFHLRYNDRYPDSVVILRMPITEETTVEEVETYFVQLAEMLKQQEIERNEKEDKIIGRF